MDKKKNFGQFYTTNCKYYFSREWKIKTLI